ncbi:PadR family transcriptional regulator [Nocardia panacis]|uniref:PadR family transcriptional regulator n=1 Tax=Nocardia panacis TaxID=2340916 RepID=A0A3A4K6N9_9NOCA|nr:PadR family transcriptional regulator [Nocardia panacis]RJO70170.1 PadR family transcriptional regulator [Nocardia panacis]
MSLRYAVLGLLADGPGSGYDLLNKFKISLGNVWPATQSQLYGELAKLAEAELIAVTDEGPRGRKEYSLTEAGRTQLREWLTTTKFKTPTRNEMLLRVFFLGVVDPEQARDYLSGIEQAAARGRRELDEIDARIDWDEDDFSTFGRIAMDWGKRFWAMNEEWARWAQAELDGR